MHVYLCLFIYIVVDDELLCLSHVICNLLVYQSLVMVNNILHITYVHNKTMLIKINYAILYRIIRDFTC